MGMGGRNLFGQLLQKIGKRCMSVQNKMGGTFEICKTESYVLLATGGVGEEMEEEVVCIAE